MLHKVYAMGIVGLAMSAGEARAGERIPADVRKHIEDRVDGDYTAGIVVGIIDAKGPSYFAYGRADRDRKQRLDENTVFEIGSITKAFTGILLADAAERGEASLDDPINKFLPPEMKLPERNGKKITLLDLATHRSGLPRLPENIDLSNERDPYAAYDQKLLYAFLSGYSLERDIGETYEYSNFGMGLAGHLLARAAGKTYEQLVIERICGPLGLGDTRITLSPEQRGRFAQGHDGTKETDPWNLNALAGAGALRSTAKDMLRFLSANLGMVESPLSPALRRSHENRRPTGQPDQSVALGWHVRTTHDTEIIWHNGGTGGFHSFSGFVPAKKIGAVVLTNSTDDIDEIGLHILEPRYELQRIRKRTKVPAEVLDGYVGYYELAPNFIFDITREGNQLFAKLTGQERYPVYAESETKFFFTVEKAQLTFNREADGKVESLTLHQFGTDQKARKLGPDYRPPAPRVEVSVDADILARYVGKYELAPGALFDVILEGGQLKIKLASQPRFPVFAESETKFFYKVVDAQITFVKDSDGKVTSLILHQGGRDQTAKKIE